MKLELKHLAPYLPYELKLKGNNSGTIYTLEACKKLGLLTEESGRSRSGVAYWSDYYDYTPILRPLSDLTEEINVNGASFIPASTYVFYRNEMINIFSSGRIGSETPYGLIKLLLEWHFDVFGLIEKGLAVDTNSLKKR